MGNEMTPTKQEATSLTPAQAERQKRLARFNVLTLYLPIGLIFILIASTIGLMVWLTLLADSESLPKWKEFSSATADIVIILVIAPMILLALLLPVLAVGWFWYTWENPRPAENWLQKWLRRTDSLVVSAADKVGTTSNQVANWSITFRASTTRFGRIVNRLLGLILPNRSHYQETER